LDPRTPKGRDAPSEARPDLESRTFDQASLPPHRPLREGADIEPLRPYWTVASLLDFLSSLCEEISIMMLQYLASWAKCDTTTLA
jgi:hypothetical protein